MLKAGRGVKYLMSNNKPISLEEAESRLDQLFLETGFSANHPAMLDWVTVKFALKDALPIKGSAKQQTDNKPSMQVCPHARLKRAVYDCTIKDSFALDLRECNGYGTYYTPGNSGFGYGYQCNKVTGKPAHVG